MNRKPQAQNTFNPSSGSCLRLDENNASLFGLGESCNRVEKHLILSFHRARVWRSTLFKPPSYIPPYYADLLLSLCLKEPFNCPA